MDTRSVYGSQVVRRGFSGGPGLSAAALTGMALAAYAAALPFDRFAQMPYGASLTRTIGLVAVGMVLGLAAVGHVRFVLPRRIVIWTLLFLGLAGASLLWTRDTDYTVQALLTLAQLVGLYLIVGLMRVERLWPWIRAGAILGGLAAAVASIAVYVLGGLDFAATGRLTLTGGGVRAVDPNYFAGGLLLPFLLALDPTPSTHKMGPTWLAVMLIGAAVVLSGSRGAVLAAVAGVGALLAATRQRRARLIVWLAIAGLALAFVAPRIPGSETVMARFSIESVAESRASQRFDIWTVALAEWMLHPLAGVGFDAGLIVLAPYFGQPKGTHNIYIEALLELGVPGLVLLLGMLGTHALAAWHGARQGKPGQGALFAALVAFAVLGGSLTLFREKPFWFVLSLVTGNRSARRPSVGGWEAPSCAPAEKLSQGRGVG